MRHIEQAPVIDPRQGICRALYASSVDSREKPAPPTGEYMLADQAKGDDGVEEEIDVDTLSLARQAGLRQSLAQELFRKIEALEQKTWSLPASSDTKHHHNNHEPSTDGAATEIQEKWPWLMPGTVCQIVHGGPKGCRVQLVCEATWSRCIPMQEYETPVRHMDDVSWGPTQRTDMTTTSEPLQPVPAEVVQEVVPVQSEPLPTTTAANSDAAVESPAAVDADKSKAPVESNELPGQHAVQAPTGEIEKPAQETVEK